MKPTLILREDRARANIAMMARKARESGVRFRPHFKTHQSVEIGGWFREQGVTAITVSSVDMARVFADAGWADITIAFPANVRELAKVNELAGRIRLNLLVEGVETVQALAGGLATPVGVWLKVDVGYGRAGIPWQDTEGAAAVAAPVQRAGMLELQGLLTHSGQTYAARSTQEIEAIYRETVARLNGLRRELGGRGFPGLQVSPGDTPGCALAGRFSDVDEIRPGNFVFYDLKMVTLGVCRESDVAVAAACPVVAVHPRRGEIILYGGAIHLSKDSVQDQAGRRLFGGVAWPTEDGWGPLLAGAYVASLSQEHGLVRAGGELLARVRPGDLLMIVPAHSCLAANLMRRYRTVSGRIIEAEAAWV